MTDDGDDMDQVMYAVTGPKSVAREATKFTLQVWAMIEAQVESYKKMIEGNDKQHEHDVRPDDLDTNVEDLHFSVSVEGCIVTPPRKSKPWNRRKTSSAHVVNVPATFTGNEFVCLVTIEAGDKMKDVFYSDFNIPRSEATGSLAELAELSLPKLAQLNNDSVIALGVGIGGSVPTRQAGSGFYVSGDGYLITCHHVVDDMDKHVSRRDAPQVLRRRRPVR